MCPAICLAIKSLQYGGEHVALSNRIEYFRIFTMFGTHKHISMNKFPEIELLSVLYNVLCTLKAPLLTAL